MRFARAITVVMAFTVFASPLFADHVRARRSQDGKATAAVTDRLVSLGVERASAERQVKTLTERELAYFAADPTRIQVVGAAQDMFSGQSDLVWYEAVGGLAMLVGGIALIFFAQSN
jgi:hypothetical protein